MISARQFGSSLRRHREGQNISLRTVEARTKIGLTLLTALEKGDCSKWPAGIYSRSWIRAYAQAIGLDPEVTVARFAECFAETAFPDAPPRSATAAEPAFRLGLAPEPAWPLRLVVERTSYACIDLGVAVLLACAAWLLADIHPLKALAATAVLIHVAAVMAGHGSLAGTARYLIKTNREAAEARRRERAGESTLAEVA